MTSGMDPRRYASTGVPHASASIRHNAEWFRPIIRTDQRIGIAEEVVLFFVGDLADIFHERMIEQRFDLRRKIFPVDGIYFGGDTQRHARLFGQGDGMVRAFLRRDAAEKREILALLGMK